MLNRLSVYSMFLRQIAGRLRSSPCSLQTQQLQCYLPLFLRNLRRYLSDEKEGYSYIIFTQTSTDPIQNADPKLHKQVKVINVTAAVCSHSSRRMRTWLTSLTAQPIWMTHTSPCKGGGAYGVGECTYCVIQPISSITITCSLTKPHPAFSTTL